MVPGGTKYGEKNNGMYMPLPLKKTLYKKFTSSCPDSFNAKGKQREREREREREHESFLQSPIRMFLLDDFYCGKQSYV